MTRSLPINGMAKRVVRCEGDDGAESDRQREEALRHGGVPHIRVAEFFPLRSDEVKHPLAGSRQGGATDEQCDEDDVRKEGSEIGLSTIILSCPKLDCGVANFFPIHYHFAG